MTTAATEPRRTSVRGLRRQPRQPKARRVRIFSAELFGVVDTKPTDQVKATIRRIFSRPLTPSSQEDQQ